MVPSIPSVCSERRGCGGTRSRGNPQGIGRRPVALGVAVLGLTASLWPTLPAPAEPRWRQGVFPVASFAGYTSHFGMRNGPSGRSEPHYGLDIAAPMGSPIRNWWGGVVREVINDGACGLGLVIGSGPYEHIYCHLSGTVSDGIYRSGTVALAAGSRVRSGQLIGHVGMSGRTTGPHLHWGVRYRGQWLNPGTILRAMAAARQR